MYSTTVWRLWVCSISVCLMPKFEMSVWQNVCDQCLFVNDCQALISFLWWIFCPGCLCVGSPFAEWLSLVSVLLPVVLQLRCNCLRWLCARCLCYGFISGVSVLYVRVYNVCLQDIYPRCLCIRRLFWRLWVWDISVCLMPKFEMSVCRMSLINICLGNDCVAFISFLWWDLLSLMPLCGISVCWMAEISLCVSKISALDECLLDNCLKNVSVSNA